MGLWAWARWGAPANAPAFKRGVAWLLDHQTQAGHWMGTPWIKMEIGRAQGQVWRTATFQSDTLTTAFALRTLLHCGMVF